MLSKESQTISFLDTGETLTDTKAFEVARAKFREVTRLSEEIASVIQQFVLLYVSHQQKFASKDAFLTTLDQDVSAFLIKKAEADSDEEGSFSLEVENIKEEKSSSGDEVEEAPLSLNIFGPKIGAEPKEVFLLFRVFGEAELTELRKTILSTGKPIFQHAAKQKGKAEKFFAENKEYVKAVWLTKGKRAKESPKLVQIVLSANVCEKLLLNPVYASVNQSAEREAGTEKLKLARSQTPTPIIVKRESPKSSKSISKSSRTYGFRKEIEEESTDIFLLLADYIISINIVE